MLAIIALVFGFVPLTGFIALILGALAVLFGLLGFARARKGIASNKIMSLIGAALGAAAAALGIWGITIVFGAFDDLTRDLESIGGESRNESAQDEGGNANDVGARGNPIPIGETARVGDWEVAFNNTALDATATVLAENQFNDPPADGRQFAMGDVTVAYIGESTGTPWLGLSFKMLGSAGNTFGDGMQDSCGVIPNPIDDHGELFPGAMATGNVCTSVPSDQVEGAVWIVEPSFSRDGRVFFAVS
ncbi:hypothetical protein [Hoyosella altamirensis]|uniref:hypothetical protein n=1 Tax=Hoyosella altamirensis TaxID=616997 RepID=UPI0007DB1BEC|nr:hypothetical protein [Hoyosella altamirensis]